MAGFIHLGRHHKDSTIALFRLSQLVPGEIHTEVKNSFKHLLDNLTEGLVFGEIKRILISSVALLVYQLQQPYLVKSVVPNLLYISVTVDATLDLTTEVKQTILSTISEHFHFVIGFSFVFLLKTCFLPYLQKRLPFDIFITTFWLIFSFQFITSLFFAFLCVCVEQIWIISITGVFWYNIISFPKGLGRAHVTLLQHDSWKIHLPPLRMRASWVKDHWAKDKMFWDLFTLTSKLFKEKRFLFMSIH